MQADDLLINLPVSKYPGCSLSELLPAPVVDAEAKMRGSAAAVLAGVDGAPAETETLRKLCFKIPRDFSL